MSRVKKYQNPASGVAVDKTKKLDEVTKVTEGSEDSSASTPPPSPAPATAVADNPASSILTPVTLTPPSSTQKGIKVAGYENNLDLDDAEWQRYYNNELSKLSSNDQADLAYALNYARNGNVSNVNESNQLNGNYDASLHNDKTNRKYYWKNSTLRDNNRQLAASKLGQMMKNYLASKDKPAEPTDYSFNWEDSVYRAAGGDKDFYHALKNQDRYGFITKTGLEFADKIRNGGAWDDKTHIIKSGDVEGTKKFYNLMQGEGKYDEFKTDLQNLSNTALKDGKVEAGELAQFVQKWGVNPYSLFGQPTKTQEEIDAENAAKAKTDKEKNDALQDVFSRYDYSGTDFAVNAPDEETSKDWTTSDWENYLSNPSNYTYNGGTNYYQADIWSPNMQMFNGRWLNGKHLADGITNGEYDRWASDRRREQLHDVTSQEGARRNETLKNYYQDLLNITGDSKIYDATGLFETSDGKRPQVLVYQDKNTAGRAYAVNTKNGYVKVPQEDIKEDPNNPGYYLYSYKDPYTGKQTTMHLGNVNKNFNLKDAQLFTGTTNRKINHFNLPAEISMDQYNGLSEEDQKKYQSSFHMFKPNTYILKKKNGGTLDLNKVKRFQLGGFVTNYDLTPDEIAERDKNRKFEKSRSAYLNGEVANKDNQDINLTASDYAKLGALGADTLGLLATIGAGPVGNIAAAGTGAVGTLANMTADIMDKENNGKSGWKIAGETAGGLALDAVSLIPGVGTGAKAAKLAKGIKGAWKIIQPALAVYGTWNSRDAFKKLVSDEKLTIDDWRQIANGLTAIAAGTRSGARALTTKKVPTHAEFAVGNKKVVFTDPKQGKLVTDAKVKYDKSLKTKADLETKLQQEGLTPEAKVDLETKLKTVNGEVEANKTTLNNLGKKGITENGAYESENFADELALNAPDIRKKWVGFGDRKEGESRWRNLNPRREMDPVYDNGFKTERVWKDASEMNAFERGAQEYAKGVFRIRGGAAGKTSSKQEESSNSEKNSKTSDSSKNVKESNNKNTKEADNKVEIISENKSRLALPERKKVLALPVGKTKESKTIILPYHSKGNGVIIQPTISEKRLALPESKKMLALPESKKMLALPSGEPDAFKTAQAAQLREEMLLKNNQNSIKKLEQKTLQQDKVRKKQVSKKSDLRKQLKHQDVKQNRTDSKDSRKSKEKASNRRSYDKAKRNLSKQGIEWRKEGGILKCQEGNQFPFMAAQNAENPNDNLLYIYKNSSNVPDMNNFPTDRSFLPTQKAKKTQLSNFGNSDLSSGLDVVKNTASKALDFASPEMLSNIASSTAMRKAYKKMKRPVGTIAPTSTKLQNRGMSNYVQQYNSIDQALNNAGANYADAKLNAAVNLSAQQNANQMKNQLGAQLAEENYNRDMHNAELESHDAAIRAQVAKQNADEQRAYDIDQMQSKLGYMNSVGNSVTNRLKELQYQKTLNKEKSDQIKQSLAGMDYTQQANAIIKEFNEKYKTQEERLAHQDEKDDQLTELKRQYYLKQQEELKKFSSGGSLSEKKELERYKTDLKRMVERDKQFNKMILERLKVQQKQLSLLAKSK